MKRLFLVLAVFLIGTAPVLAAKGSVQYLPKDGGPPVELNPAIAFGQLAGRFAPIVGIATSAIQLCIETQCMNMLSGRNAVPPPVPGWSDPATPPSGFTPTLMYIGNGRTTWFDSPDPACLDALSVSILNQSYTYHHAEVAGSNLHCYLEDKDSGSVQSLMSGSAVVRCPTGYAQVGGVCVVNTPSLVKWPSDGIPTFGLDSNNNWIPHPNDPDTINPATGQPYQTPPPVGSLYSQDDYGNPADTSIQPTADGGTVTTQHTEGQNQTTGTTDTTTHQTTTDAAGNVVNYTYQYHANTTLNQTTQGTDLELPTDYAREATLQTGVNKLQAILDEMKKPPQGPPTIPDDEEGPESSEIPLPTISADGPELGSGGCPPDISIAALGTTITVPLGPMCEGAGYVAPLILGFAWLLAAKIIGGGLPLE